MPVCGELLISPRISNSPHTGWPSALKRCHDEYLGPVAYLRQNKENITQSVTCGGSLISKYCKC